MVILYFLVAFEASSHYEALFPQQLLSEVFTICCLLPVTSLNPYPSSQIQ